MCLILFAYHPDADVFNEQAAQASDQHRAPVVPGPVGRLVRRLLSRLLALSGRLSNQARNTMTTKRSAFFIHRIPPSEPRSQPTSVFHVPRVSVTSMRMPDTAVK